MVQEGGYRTRTLGINARHFFTGLSKGHRAALPGKAYGIRHPPSRNRALPHDPLAP